jgi:hypothetical protein
MFGERSVLLGLTFIFSPVGSLPLQLAELATFGLAISLLIPALALKCCFLAASLGAISIIAPTRSAHAHQLRATLAGELNGRLRLRT